MRTNIQLKTRGQKSKSLGYRVLASAHSAFAGLLVFGGFSFKTKNTHTHKPTKDTSFVLTVLSVPRKTKYTIEIWLILPVVICLFQGLSHACLRITALQESAHGSLHQTQSAAKMLRSPQNWIPWRNAKLIHESIQMSSTHAACSAGRSEASCE